MCFVDNNIRFFRFKGFSKNRIEIKQLDDYYKSPFIVTGFATGTHILTKESIGILCGDQGFMQLYMDPKSDKFMQPVTIYNGKPHL